MNPELERGGLPTLNASTNSGQPFDPGTLNPSPNGDLRAGSHIHMIAVCGVGMASLAGLLQAKGYRVTGSDQNVYPPMSSYLAEIGINILPGFHPDHLIPHPD